MGSAFLLALLQEVSVHTWLICWLLRFIRGLLQGLFWGESFLAVPSCQKWQMASDNWPAAADAMLPWQSCYSVMAMMLLCHWQWCYSAMATALLCCGNDCWQQLQTHSRWLWLQATVRGNFTSTSNAGLMVLSGNMIASAMHRATASGVTKKLSAVRGNNQQKASWTGDAGQQKWLNNSHVAAALAKQQAVMWIGFKKLSSNMHINAGGRGRWQQWWHCSCYPTASNGVMASANLPAMQQPDMSKWNLFDKQQSMHSKWRSDDSNFKIYLAARQHSNRRKW